MTLTRSQIHAMDDQIKYGREKMRELEDDVKELHRTFGGLQTMLYQINVSSTDSEVVRAENSRLQNDLAVARAQINALQRELDDTKNRNRLLAAALNSYTGRS